MLLKDKPLTGREHDLPLYTGTADEHLLMIGSHELSRYGFNAEQIQADFDQAGFYPTHFYGVHVVEYQGHFLPAHYEVGMEFNSSLLVGHTALELGFTDGVRYNWDSRVFFFPEVAYIHGERVLIPPMIQEMGYHVVRKNSPDPAKEPLVRIDSLCSTSMVDGHYASAGQEGLGCDCAPQRHIVQQLIQRSDRGGMSILSPLAGRGNGSFVHTGQLMQQNYAVRNGLAVPPTYQAHEGQGFPYDSRDQFYGIDAMLLKFLFPGDPDTTSPQIMLFTNNPQKVAAVRQMGIGVTPVAIHDPALWTYYSHSPNFGEKAAAGHHTAPTTPMDVDELLDVLHLNGSGTGNEQHG